MEKDLYFACKKCKTTCKRSFESYARYAAPICNECNKEMAMIEEDQFLAQETDDMGLGEALGIVVDLARQNVYDGDDSELDDEKHRQEMAIEVVYQHSICIGS